MSDKRGDRYCGMAMRRQSKLTEVSNRFSTALLEIENSGDKLLKIAVEKNDSALLEIANSILYQVVLNEGWIEG